MSCVYEKASRVQDADSLPVDHKLIESLREFGVSDPELAERHIRDYLAGNTTLTPAKPFIKELLHGTNTNI